VEGEEKATEDTSIAKQDEDKEDDGVIYDPMGRKLKSK